MDGISVDDAVLGKVAIRKTDRFEVLRGIAVIITELGIKTFKLQVPTSEVQKEVISSAVAVPERPFV